MAVSNTFFHLLAVGELHSSTAAELPLIRRALVCRFLRRARYGGEHLHNNPRPDDLQNTYQRYVTDPATRRRRARDDNVDVDNGRSRVGDAGVRRRTAGTMLIYHNTTQNC